MGYSLGNIHSEIFEFTVEYKEKKVVLVLSPVRAQ